MNKNIISDDPDVFMYKDPMNKKTNLAVSISAGIFVISLLYVLIGWIMRYDSASIQVALFLAIASLTTILLIAFKGAKEMMDVRSEFTKWSVMNYCITPLEFLITKDISKGIQGRVLMPAMESSPQKFLNSENETIEVQVTQDRLTGKNSSHEEGPYIRVTIDAPKC